MWVLHLIPVRFFFNTRQRGVAERNLLNYHFKVCCETKTERNLVKVPTEEERGNYGLCLVVDCTSVNMFMLHAERKVWFVIFLGDRQEWSQIHRNLNANISKNNKYNCEKDIRKQNKLVITWPNMAKTLFYFQVHLRVGKKSQRSFQVYWFS